MRKKVAVFLLVVAALATVSCTRNASSAPIATLEATVPPTENILATNTAVFGTQAAQAELTAQAAVPTPTEVPEPTDVPTPTEIPFVADDVAEDHPEYETIKRVVTAETVSLKESCFYSSAAGMVFCPSDNVPRGEMATSICSAIYESGKIPGAIELFSDRTLREELWYDEDGEPTETHALTSCVEQLYRDDYIIDTNRGDPFNPNRFVRNKDYWAFFLLGVHGSDYTPPEATGLYVNCPAQVDHSDWCEAFINQGYYDKSLGPPDPDETITRVELARAVEQYLQHPDLHSK